jgi:uncharacterized protein YodC (DUF2158 family)
MSNFKKGDEVQLKSGGPVMTIEELGDFQDTHGIADGARCIWFDHNDIKQRVFDVATLEIFTGTDRF